MADNKIKVIITNKQKAVKIPTGIRMLIRRCCNAVLQLEKFEGKEGRRWKRTTQKSWAHLMKATL